MKCPGCGTAVKDGTEICPKCDYIIDSSFLEADAPPSTPSKPPAGPKPRPRATGAASARATTGEARIRSGPPRSGGSGARPAASRAPSMPEAPPRESDEARAERSRSRASDDWRPKNQPAGALSPQVAPVAAKDGLEEQEQAFQEAKLFVKYLPTSDKLALAAFAINILVSFFPWKETIVEGEVLGIMSLGAPVFVMSVLGLAAIVVRVRRAMPKLNPLLPWLGQLGAAGFCIAWCLIFMYSSNDGRVARAMVGNVTMKISSPSFGVFVALICSIAALGGTLLGLRDKTSHG